MKCWYMLTVVGRDRPGIVAGLTEALYRGGANLGEASMARLGGNFTVMVMAETDAGEAGVKALVEPFAKGMDLHVHVDAIEGRLHEHLEPNVRIVVHGADRPGIVAQVTGALAGAGFNILDLETDVGGSGKQPIYVMIIDGHAQGGAGALEAVLAPVRAAGVEVRITAIDVLVG